jgi:hypothetical protein
MTAFSPAFHVSLAQTVQEQMTMLSIFSLMRDYKTVVIVWEEFTGPDYYLLLLSCDKFKDFYVLLTEHHGTILVNHQLDAQILYFNNMCILQSSTCFEQYYAHPQEVSCINTASGVVTVCKWLTCSQVKRGLAVLSQY